METILIVDDEKNYLTILSAVLEEEGFEVLTALGGQEALEIYKTSDLDLVVTDMKMPEMDGIELLENIKQLDPDLPVMMMSGKRRRALCRPASPSVASHTSSFRMKPVSCS